MPYSAGKKVASKIAYPARNSTGKNLPKPTHGFLHHIHKWRPWNFLFGYDFKEIHVMTLPSATKYVILRSFIIWELTTAKLWLFQI